MAPSTAIRRTPAPPGSASTPDAVARAVAVVPPHAATVPLAVHWKSRRHAPPNRQDVGVLALRPNCECCDKDLPPGAEDARICSYECTFCADCVTNVLHDVCPNCGGGFVPLTAKLEHVAPRDR